VSKKIGSQHPEHDHALTRILHVFEGVSAFSFFLMLALALLYVIGNLQSFTVDTQEMLLRVLQVVGFAAAGVNSYALLLIVLWSIRHRTFLGMRFFLSLFSLILGLILTLGAAFIAMLLRPDW
jgi:hypothetical protein